jgi:hypothetical protein
MHLSEADGRSMSSSDKVARLLHELEHHIDQAFACSGDLAAALPRARIEERLSAVVGQPVISYIAKAISALGDARANVVQSHLHLERVARAEGIDVVAWGEERPKPAAQPFVGADASHLSVAA